MRPRPPRPCEGLRREQLSEQPGAEERKGGSSRAVASAFGSQTFLEATAARPAAPWSPLRRGGLPSSRGQGRPGGEGGCPGSGRFAELRGRPRWGGEPPGAELQGGGGTLTASPEAEGDLPRDPAEAQKGGHLGGGLTPCSPAAAWGWKPKCPGIGRNFSELLENLVPGNFPRGARKSHPTSSYKSPGFCK